MISDELKRIYLDANVDIQLIRTIQLSHSSFSKEWYLVQMNDTTSFKGKLEDDSLVTYEAGAFDIKLPDATTKGQSNAQFVIDATSEEVISELWNFKSYLMNGGTEPIVLSWREYLSNSTDIQNSLLNIKLMDIEFNYNQIQGAGSRPDIVNRPFPFDRYDATKFKGLNYL